MLKKIFSGVQPSGNLHLGNFLGAIKNFVSLQNQDNTDCVYCIVDLHAITTKQDPKILKEKIVSRVSETKADDYRQDDDSIFFKNN